MPLNVEVLQQSFERVKPRADEFAASFYENLFNLYPEVKPLFAKTDMANQSKKLLNSLVLVVESLRNPEALGEVLKALGARHVGYGAIAKYYPAVGKALLVTFEQYLQEDWTPEVRQAWVNAYKAITAQMLKGAGVAHTPEDVQSETGAIPEKQVAVATAAPAEPKQKPKQEEVPDSAPAGLPIELLTSSFERVKPRADEFAVSFYENLFNLYPEVKPLFAKTDMANQYKKLLNSLVLVVENLRNPEVLGQVLDALGARHVGYGALAIHYPAVGKALLVTFEQYLQKDWTPEVRQAWVTAFGAITAQMLKGAGVAHTPEDVQSETGAIPEKQVAVATAAPAEPKQKPKQEEVPDSAPAGLPIELLTSSFEKVKPRADEFAVSFYENLFTLYPEVKPLFAKTDMANQYKKLLNALVLVVESLRNPEALGEVLKALGARHVGYGALAIHYPAVGKALLVTFEQYLQKDWTPEVRQAWVTAFGAITAQMLKGAGEDSSPEVVPQQPAARLEERSELKAELKKEAEPLQAQAESQKKPLVSIQWDGEILQVILGKIAERYQQFQTQLSVQQWGDTLKQLPGKLTESQLFKTPLSAERLREIFKKVSEKISDTFWKLPAPAVAVIAAIIMTGFFLVAEENSLLAEILEGADAISLLVALVLFIKEGPERRKQFHYQAWGAVDAAHGVKVSYARILALQDLNEDGVSLRGLDAAGAELVEINLPRANLSDANLRGSDLSNANLSYANLDNANISQVKLVSGNLSHAKLGFARLSKTNLSSANLSSANLICADLSQANLSGANLSHASLSGANLEGAYLSGANLKDAKVSVYELSKAFLDGAIMPDGSIYQSEKD